MTNTFFSRRCIRTAFLLLALFLLAACSVRVERDPQELVENMGADPTILNPILSTDAYASEIEGQVYESLFEYDKETLEFVPRLATHWEVAPDKLHYTFHLRQDVHWHDGQPFTADDVIYTFEKIRDPQVDAPAARQTYRDVEKIEKLSEFSVRFTYQRPYFRGFLIVGALSVIPKHIFDDGSDFNTHPANRRPVGTGPYRFAAWETGRKITLVRNDAYWRATPAITKRVYKIIPDANAAFQLLKKGGLDVMGVRPIQWKHQTTSKKFAEQFSKYRYYLPNFSYIGWNMRRPFFADKRVRRALAMLLDRPGILAKKLYGEGEIVTGSFYRFSESYDATIPPWPFDPAEAKRLLDEAGWIDHDGDGIRDQGGVPFRFTLLFGAGSSSGTSIGLFLREELLRVGIELELQQLEWTAFIKLLDERRFDSIFLSWALPPDQDPFQLWHSSQVDEGSNIVGFKNATADRLIEEASGEFDAKRRAELFRQLHRILHDEQPYAFLFAQPSLVVVQKRFANVKEYRLGLEPLEWRIGPNPALYAW